MADIKVTHVVFEEVSRYNKRKFENAPAYVTETSLSEGEWTVVPEDEIKVRIAKSLGTTVDDINKGTHDTEKDGTIIFKPAGADTFSDSFAVYLDGNYYMIGRYFDYNWKDQETVEIEYDLIMAIRDDIFSRMINYSSEERKSEI